MSDAEEQALAFVRARAEAARDRARAGLGELLDQAGAPGLDALLAAVRRRAKVALAFHPDRPLADGSTVAEGLLREGRYRGQFETGISNGSRSAFPGGERHRWETALFGGAYDRGARGDERPKYGSLDLVRHADGPSPRFGSCYLVLREQVRERCTLTWGDSHLGPEQVGTLELIEPVLFALLSSVEARGEALGVAGIDVRAFVERLIAPEQGALAPASTRPVGRALDDYIEVQVHQRILLAEDVEALVVDPAFDGTPTGEQLDRIAARFGLALDRHPGFVLAITEVPVDFRGPRMPALAERLSLRFASTPGELDCAVLGRAARSLHAEPERWRDWDTPEETLQHLKQLWHVLVRFGRARAEGGEHVPSPP